MLRCLSCKQIWVRILPDQIRENPDCGILLLSAFSKDPEGEEYPYPESSSPLTQTLFFNNKFLYFLVGARTKLN